MSKPVYPTFDISHLTANKSPRDILNADRFSTYLSSNPHLEVPHGHSFYHMLFFTQGRGEHVIDFVNFPVKDGMIYFMRPGQIHHWRFKGPVDGYIVNFSPTFFDQMGISTQVVDHFAVFGADVAQHVMMLDKKTQTAVKALFEQILSEQSGGRPSSQLMIASLLIQILVTIDRNVPKLEAKGSTDRSATVLTQFQQLIEKYFIELRLPKEYASLLYITPNHLNAICKETLGKPAGEVIRDRVLLEAKRLLINFDLTIGEIASRLNFPDHSYFIKFFRKYTGMTPEAFRKGNYK